MRNVDEMIKLAKYFRLYNNKNKTEEYNVYTACLVINCASNGKLYLYDIVDIKKEASNPLKTENSQVVQNRFF